MYQSTEFITMNDCSSEPKRLAMISLYHVSVVETRIACKSKAQKTAIEKSGGYWKSN